MKNAEEPEAITGAYGIYANTMLGFSQTLVRILRQVGIAAVKRRGRTVLICLFLVVLCAIGFKDFYIEEEAGKLWLPEVRMEVVVLLAQLSLAQPLTAASSGVRGTAGRANL